MTGSWCLSCGRGAAGISSREASPISASSGTLTWDEVSAGLGKSPSLVGRGVSRTMGFSLFGVEFSDMCPNMSNPAWNRSSLTSMVILTSLSTFGRVALMGPAISMEVQSPEGSTFSSGPSGVDLGCPPLSKWVCLQVGLCLWPETQAGRLSQGPHTHSSLLGR